MVCRILAEYVMVPSTWLPPQFTNQTDRYFADGRNLVKISSLFHMCRGKGGLPNQTACEQAYLSALVAGGQKAR